MLGMAHPTGPGGEYDDPYCVMGYGHLARSLDPLPEFVNLTVRDGPGFWK